MRRQHLFAVFILTVYFALSIFYYYRLPQNIPVHFNIQGKVDNWTGRSMLSWLALPLVSLGVFILTTVISKIMRRYPKSVNLPHKKEFLLLLPEQQQKVLDLFENMLIYIDICIFLLLSAIQFGSYNVAVGAAQSLPVYVIGAIFGFNVVVLILAALTIGRADDLIKSFKVDHP